MQKRNKNNLKKPLIGFIGQGWIGKNYADDFERRGFKTVRYSLEKPYIENGDKIKECDIVFIAVPTPTTKKGFDFSHVRSSIQKAGKGTIVVIKSTILPGTTELLQKENPDIIVTHSPEFLRKKTAANDASHPDRNIIGIPTASPKYKIAAKKVMNVLPRAPFELICSSREAELIKYANNNFLYVKVVYANMLYDAAKSLQCNWEHIMNALAADPRIGPSHLNPFDSHGGRGAGGYCLIKDLAAFRKWHKTFVNNHTADNVLTALERKNIDFLVKSKKDINVLKDVYGKNIIKRNGR